MDVRFHRVFWNHPKVLRAGNEATGVFARLLLYCAEFEIYNARLDYKVVRWISGDPSRRILDAFVGAALVVEAVDELILLGRDELWTFYNPEELSKAERARLMGVIFARDGFRCTYCGSAESLTLDHVIPRSRGGSNKPNNITTACNSCNSQKGDKTPEEWRSGETRRRWSR